MLQNQTRPAARRTPTPPVVAVTRTVFYTGRPAEPLHAVLFICTVTAWCAGLVDRAGLEDFLSPIFPTLSQCQG